MTGEGQLVSCTLWPPHLPFSHPFGKQSSICIQHLQEVFHLMVITENPFFSGVEWKRVAPNLPTKLVIFLGNLLRLTYAFQVLRVVLSRTIDTAGKPPEKEHLHVISNVLNEFLMNKATFQAMSEGLGAHEMTSEFMAIVILVVNPRSVGFERALNLSIIRSCFSSIEI